MIVFDPIKGDIAWFPDAESPIAAGTTSQYWRGDKTFQALNKAAVGLSLVDNTSDANKPISTATATALVAKADLVAGVVPSSQIPAIAITEYLGAAANQSEMLSAGGEKGDWVIRSDLGTTWVITGSNPTQLSSWTQLSYPTAPVVSVQGQTGAITLSPGNLGATTIGASMFGLSNPSAITFPRFNADNSVTALSASSFRTAIGAGTSSFSGAFSALSGIPATAVGYGITGGAYLDALTGTAAARGLGKAIYITTTRSDGRAGTGTPEDPLAATDLNAIWATVVAAAPSYVELAKATYTVSSELTPIAGCWLNANGSTIQCSAAFGVNNVHKSIFHGLYNEDYSHFSITGGTWDGNINGQTATKSVISFFLLHGSYNLAEWNTIKNFGSKSDTGIESFIGGFWASNVVKGYGNVIQNNTVTSIITANSGQATIFFNNGADVGVMDDFTKPTDMWQHGSRILNNNFQDIGFDGATIQCIELGAWSVGEVIAGNNFHHIKALGCIYIDTGSTWDSVVRDNYGEDVRIGILIGNANKENVSFPGIWFNRRLTIENNQMFPQTTVGAGYGIVVSQPTYTANKNFDLIVRGNKVGTYWNGTVANVGIALRGLAGGTVEDNWVDAAVGADNGHFEYDHCANVLFRNNSARVLYDGGNNTGIVFDGDVNATNSYLTGPVDSGNRILMASDNSSPMMDFSGAAPDGTAGWLFIHPSVGMRFGVDDYLSIDGTAGQIQFNGRKVLDQNELCIWDANDGGNQYSVILRASSSTQLSLSRVLTLDLDNGDRTLKLAANFTVSHNVALDTDGTGTRTLNIGAGGTLGSNMPGTGTNDSASAGNIGQIVSALVAVGSTVSITSATATNITSISLTAGDWDVEGNVNFLEGVATVSARSAGISATSATLPTDGSEAYCGVQSTITSETNTITLPRKRISISTTTTIYLVGKATYSAGTCEGFGCITARRVR